MVFHEDQILTSKFILSLSKARDAVINRLVVRLAIAVGSLQRLTDAITVLVRESVVSYKPLLEARLRTLDILVLPAISLHVVIRNDV